MAFYKEAFGWELQQWGDMPYWLVVTRDKAQPSIDGAIAPLPMPNMTQRVVCTMSVDDNEAAAAEAVAAGAVVVVPKRAVPGSGWLSQTAAGTYRGHPSVRHGKASIRQSRQPSPPKAGVSCRHK